MTPLLYNHPLATALLPAVSAPRYKLSFSLLFLKSASFRGFTQKQSGANQLVLCTVPGLNLLMLAVAGVWGSGHGSAEHILKRARGYLYMFTFMCMHVCEKEKFQAAWIPNVLPLFLRE